MHEDRSKMSEKTLNMKGAIDSLREELEAIDWYNQRVDACTDENLKKILIHNADEEKEHAAMLLEWIR
ncbi:ferritin [Methanolobus vulcani]|uniref:ferritin family protein n=1 Tax=Methanolobus vulcani TaxID=38026 RepID=UPI00374385D9